MATQRAIVEYDDVTGLVTLPVLGTQGILSSFGTYLPSGIIGSNGVAQEAGIVAITNGTAYAYNNGIFDGIAHYYNGIFDGNYYHYSGIFDGYNCFNDGILYGTTHTYIGVWGNYEGYAIYGIVDNAGIRAASGCLDAYGNANTLDYVLGEAGGDASYPDGSYVQADATINGRSTFGIGGISQTASYPTTATTLNVVRTAIIDEKNSITNGHALSGPWVAITGSDRGTAAGTAAAGGVVSNCIN